MNCKLSRSETYPVVGLGHDEASDQYLVVLRHPLAECPNSRFVGKATVEVKSGSHETTMRFSEKLGQPVILVPDLSYVERIELPEDDRWETWGVMLLIMLAVIVFMWRGDKTSNQYRE